MIKIEVTEAIKKTSIQNLRVIEPTNTLSRQFREMALEFSKYDLESFFKFYSQALDDFGSYVRSLVYGGNQHSKHNERNYWIIDNQNKLIASAFCRLCSDGSPVKITLSIRPSMQSGGLLRTVKDLVIEKISQSLPAKAYAGGHSSNTH